MTDPTLLTPLQAMKAMRLLLDQLYKRTGSDDVGGLLSDTAFTAEDGEVWTADPGAWEEWLEAVKRAVAAPEAHDPTFDDDPVAEAPSPPPTLT